MFGKLLGALGLGKIQLIAIVSGIAVVLTIVGMLWLQNSSLRQDNQVLSENNGKLAVAVEEQKQTIQSAVSAISEWEAQMEQIQNTMDELAQVNRVASQEARRLDDVFARHDLGGLSLRKPDLIRDRINSGTAAMFELFERATNGRNGIDGPDRTPR